MSKNCLVCYEPLTAANAEYHSRCLVHLFGVKSVPVVDFSLSDIEQLATQEINHRVSITGVQRKLSIDLNNDELPRLTIVGLWGKFIFKPPSPEYPHLPEIEDLCMHLADKHGLQVATHGLIRLPEGQLGYICRRFDREGDRRLAMEDLCQLTETLTHDKYYSSVEKVGRALRRYSDNPGLDVQRLLEMVLFSYLIGNSDMHLKNYALLRDASNEISLSPAYDMVATQLLLPEDKEESALNINGRKHKLRYEDFLKLTEYLKIPPKFLEQTLTTWEEKQSMTKDVIEKSFLPTQFKKQFIELYSIRLNNLTKR